MAKVSKMENGTQCGCNGHPCGVDKSYDEIFKSWSARYMDRNFTINDAQRIHNKWKSLGKLVAQGRL